MKADGGWKSLFKRFLFTSLFVLGLFFCLRPLFAECIDPTTYTRTADSERYLALPFSGDNFSANSQIGYMAGRYYLKGKVAAALLDAYAELRQTHPDLRFLYGEMGWKGGGRFRPHRTHQKGMSADFITPVYKLNETGERVPDLLPCAMTNLWGYGIRLDQEGRFENYTLDTRALIAHLAALKKSVKAHGIRIGRVIVDPPLLSLLRADPEFASLAGMEFMKNKAWFPHDSHYHVDFVEQGTKRP